MSIPTADEYFDRIHRVISVLDDENIKIINTMKKHGPRNLQDVSRKSGVPYPTVYTRVNKLESQGLLRARTIAAQAGRSTKPPIWPALTSA